MSNSVAAISINDLVKLQDVRAPNGTWVPVSKDVYSEFREMFAELQTCGDELIESWSEDFNVEVIAFNNNLIHAEK